MFPDSGTLVFFCKYHESMGIEERSRSSRSPDPANRERPVQLDLTPGLLRIPDTSIARCALLCSLLTIPPRSGHRVSVAARLLAPVSLIAHHHAPRTDDAPGRGLEGRAPPSGRGAGRWRRPGVTPRPLTRQGLLGLRLFVSGWSGGGFSGRGRGVGSRWWRIGSRWWRIRGRGRGSVVVGGGFVVVGGGSVVVGGGSVVVGGGSVVVGGGSVVVGGGGVGVGEGEGPGDGAGEGQVRDLDPAAAEGRCLPRSRLREQRKRRHRPLLPQRVEPQRRCRPHCDRRPWWNPPSPSACGSSATYGWPLSSTSTVKRPSQRSRGTSSSHREQASQRHRAKKDDTRRDSKRSGPNVHQPRTRTGCPQPNGPAGSP